MWGENMLGCLSANIICSEKRTVFRELGSTKTVSFREQIMSKNKYLNKYFPAKWWLLCLLSFKYLLQHAQF